MDPECQCDKHSKGMEGVVAELQCAVCLDLYRNPRILPCSHILCHECAERLFNNNFVTCPVCRENCYVSGGLDALPQVKTLVNIIERYQNGGPDVPQEADVCGERDQPCNLCRGTPKKAVRRCLDCKASYCRLCLELSHPSKEPFLQHHLVEPKNNLGTTILKCPVHEQPVNIFCENCQKLGCLLCADRRGGHNIHRILSLNDGYTTMKELVLEGLQKLEGSHKGVKQAASSQKEVIEKYRGQVRESRKTINEQCDDLVQEIQARREFFLSDLDYDNRNKSDALKEHLDSLQKQTASAKSTIGYAKEVLNETDPSSFLQLAADLLTRMAKSASETEEKLRHSQPSMRMRVIDVRKERAMLRDLSYLSVPSTPAIDLPKCLRSSTSVVIVLCPPANEHDVIDGYKVYYASERQKALGEQNEALFQTPMEERKYSRGYVASNSVCLIHDDLAPQTVYWFSVKAFNNAGESHSFHKVDCTTLARNEATDTLPTPEISESMCRIYTTSIQVYSPSPMEIPPDLDITHYLLYRETGGFKIWKSIPLYGRLDHRVFNLEPDTTYDFVIMACDQTGQCQVSNQVCLRTEKAAF